MSKFPNDPKPWKTLSSKYLFNRPWLTMRQDHVVLPTGGEVEEFYVWEYPAWVNVVAITKANEVVLIRQYRYAIGEVYYEIPAGVHDKPEESLLEAAKRELLEETGFGGGTWQPWMELCANPAIQTNITHTFLATDVEPVQAQTLEATEEISVHLLPVNALKKLILDREIIQALHTAPLLKYLLTRED
ncbi:NUDIX hydrolase [Chloroherpeton thalassium ATCC 35110]|uniref:GDP-mannose pyrophosphatase n=1 Tax=Chloroherpeton thalassium (strain ATCC 35110 / GB-78) TaxID=517418 RepID=B3QVN5_CHLT3|nr:NUDIX hydrolase [Chloroherpeton thalassium]ACF13092.1 NUDIX hydrolase [Chloroherpeton thalassium ATCC 35110]